MSKRRDGSAARARNDFPPENVAEAPAVPSDRMAHGTTGTYNAVEDVFFKKGDLGIVEPPIYLPKDPIVIPLLGVLFLAGLTAFVLL